MKRRLSERIDNAIQLPTERTSAKLSPKKLTLAVMKTLFPAQEPVRAEGTEVKR